MSVDFLGRLTDALAERAKRCDSPGGAQLTPGQSTLSLMGFRARGVWVNTYEPTMVRVRGSLPSVSCAVELVPLVSRAPASIVRPR